MVDYPGNSHRAKEAEKAQGAERAEPQRKPPKATGKIASPSPLKKALNALVVKDIKDVLAYVATDVLLPQLKKAIMDAVNGGVSMMLNGEEPQAGGKTVPASKVSYREYYDRSPSGAVARKPAAFELDNVVVGTRREAEDVLDELNAGIEEYGVVSVAEYYDLVGITTSNYMYDEYGWRSLATASVCRCQEGFLIKMPKPRPITRG